MRHVIYGAGAIGGVLGAKLHQAGHDVVLVARGSHYEGLRRDGLTLIEPERDEQILNVPVVDRIDAAELADGDVAFLTMKSQDTEAALRDLARVAPGVTVVCAQNGVENERLALRRFASVIGVLVVCPAVLLRPGVVALYSAPKAGILDVGRYPSGLDRAEEIASVLRGAGYLSEAREDIMAWKYAKLLSNLMMALTALVGEENRGSAPALRLRDEGESVLRAAGIDFVGAEIFAERRDELASSRRGTSATSTWQSIDRGTDAVETDFVNGEISFLGRLHGLAVPVNAAVQDAMREHIRAGGRPGTVDLAQIEGRLNHRS